MEKQIKENFQKQIGILKANEKSNSYRIEKTNVEKNALLGITEDSEGKSLDPVIQEKLENEVKNLYKVAKNKKDTLPDPSVDQKIQNSNPLALIEETENILNKYLEEFLFIEQNEKETFQDISKRIKQEKRRENREFNNRMEIEKQQAIARKRQQDKDMKNVKKVGKQLMQRMYAPPVKRMEVKKKQRTEEEEDTLKYLGMELSNN